MINIIKSKENFKKFLNSYEIKDNESFKMREKHTYRVAANAKYIAENLNLTKEDIELAELIGLLHDIGRFEELKQTKTTCSNKFDHASYGVKMLFDDGMIRQYIDDDKYDEIIKKAIGNHSKLKIEDGLDDKTQLHSKIIRDADKLDIFYEVQDEKIEVIFPTIVNNVEDMENSLISDSVFETIQKKQCVNTKDRITPLDYWVFILAFTFDLNFNVTLKKLKQKNYINYLVDRFKYKDIITKERMESIRKALNEFIDEKSELVL